MNMIEGLEGYAVRVADQRHVAQWAAHASIAYAQEKRQVDAAYALASVEGHTKTELVNALRNIAQQLRP